LEKFEKEGFYANLSCHPCTKGLPPWQIEAACQTYQEKYFLAGGKYRQFRDILADPSCGLYKAMAHPEYLYEILKNCEDQNKSQTDSDPLYIPNEIVHSVPLYNLKILLMQTTAKAIWLQNSPNNILDLLERWFPNQTQNDKESSKDKKKKNKIGPYFILKDINSFQKYLELPTYKGRMIITGYITSMIYQKIKRKILHIYCPDNQQLPEFACVKKSCKKNYNESFQVEIVEKNDFVKLLKPICFTKTSQVNKARFITQDDLLDCSSQRNKGKINWISADAGMGKTCLLNELKRRWQNLEANQSYEWVFMIDLTKIGYNNLTEDMTFEDFLIGISPEIDRKQAWLPIALEHDKNSGKILLLFDAWDEVKPSMHDKIKVFIERIPSNMDCIIVTRPYGLSSMDLSKWSHHYFMLKPFDEELTNEYIFRFFSKENFSEDCLKNLSRKIFEWMKSLGRDFSQTLGIPLQISQLCEVLLSKMQKEPDLDISEWFDENKPLNIVRLYDQFIETVFRKLCNIDSDDPEILYRFWKPYFEHLSTQAYQQLFDKPQRYIKDYHRLDQLPKGPIQLLKKTGLVKRINIDEGKIEFAHQTYKEYFGAFYLLRILFEKKESDLYQKVVKDINNTKYMGYYQMVFVFAFQISFHGHSLLLQNQDQKEELVREFWKILHRDPKDVLGRASSKLSFACLGPLTNEQKEEFFSRIPQKYCPKEILSSKGNSIWTPTSIWIKKNSGEEMNEELEAEEIISHLLDKSDVLRFTKEFIQKWPNSKKQLAVCFKEVCLREDLDWFWDINGGFQAMALLGDDFNEDHAAYFKKRIMIDPSRIVEPVVSAILLLGRVSSKNEIIKGISSILLMIFGRFGARFSHVLDVIVQTIHPSRLIYVLLDIDFFNKRRLQGSDTVDEFEDPLSLIFAIAEIAEYAVIVLKDELLIDTGKTRLTLSRDLLTNDQNVYIEKVQEEYDPSTCSYIYFLKKELRVQETPLKIFISMPRKEKLNMVYNCFLDGKEAKETAAWLRKYNLLKKDFANILGEIVARHQGKNDNWARDGGWRAITKMGKYFNKRFGDFLLLRGQLWPNNIPEIQKELKTLEQDLLDLGKENYNDNEVNVAWKCFEECFGELKKELSSSRRKYFMEKIPFHLKKELNRTATI